MDVSVRTVMRRLADGTCPVPPMPQVFGRRLQWSSVAVQAYLAGGYRRFANTPAVKAREQRSKVQRLRRRAPRRERVEAAS